MKKVILIHKTESEEFQDDQILSVVEEAGDSILLVDQPTGVSGSPTTSTEIVRLNLLFLVASTASDETLTAAERSMRLKLTDLEGGSRAIWVLDTRNSAPGEVVMALDGLRSKIFHSAEPPRALVLETDSGTQFDVLQDIQNAFGFSREREKTLTRAARRGWWIAVFLRLFGLRGSQKLRRLPDKLARLG